MKVLHFHFGKDGGAERFFVHLINGLARAGIEQKIVIRPDRKWMGEIDPSIEVIESHYRSASLDRFLLPIRMKRLVRSWQPDSVLGWMPRGAKLMPDEKQTLRLVRLGDYPLSLDKFRNIDVVVCNTPGIARHVKELGWTRGVEVISNFTDPETVAPIPRSELNTPPEAFVVSSMGRFVPRKGFDVTLRALVTLPDVYFWLLGGGEQEENLHALATELGVIDRVRFAGWQGDPRPYIAASDCFIMSSSHEPLGNVILEAWAQRVPVISTRAEGPSWFMRDGEDGLMVDIGDASGMAAAVTKLQGDSKLRECLVEGGLETLEKKFSEGAVVQAYIDLFGSRNSDSRKAELA
jgi:glycosyltransferase involved in cell wall biosynthesis